MELEKWIDWVWIPAVGLAYAFARWVVGKFETLHQSNIALHEATEKRLLAQAQAIDDAVSALHEKANEIRTDFDAYKLNAEQRFVSQQDLEKTESHLSKNIADLTRAIEKLSDRVA